MTVAEWEPYVRIWQEVATGDEVAMLSARDYRQLCAVVHAAIEFRRHHDAGQPRTPGSRYPMTIAECVEWQDSWDKLYGNMTCALEAIESRRVQET